MARPVADEDVFRAVADPTRRAVLELLVRDGEQPVTALAQALNVSMPMVSRHLAVLRSAELVTEVKAGRQRLYRLRPEPLRELFDWASIFAGFWTERLRGLADFLETTQGQDNGHDNGGKDGAAGDR